MKRRKKYDSDYINEYNRRHSSFTGFSRFYPGGSMGKRTSYTERMRRRKIIKTVLAVAGICAIVAVGYFITDVMLDISEMPKIEETTASQSTTKAQAETTTQAAQPAVISSNMKAVYIGTDALADTQSMSRELENVKAQGGNAAIINFKNTMGYLCYDSSIAQMETTAADENASSAVSDCIALCKQENIAVIARIHCFKDPLAAGKFRGTMAINYMGNTGMLWLDKSFANGGKPWLNPYSEDAQQYLYDIIKEICELNVDFVLLDSVQYPSVGLSRATFAGENEQGALTRNGTLLDFVDGAVKAAGKTVVILMVDGQATASGTSQIYDGTLLGSAAKAYAVDLRGITLESPIRADGKTVIPVKTASGEKTPCFIIRDGE